MHRLAGPFPVARCLVPLRSSSTGEHKEHHRVAQESAELITAAVERGAPFPIRRVGQVPISRYFDFIVAGT